MHARQWIARDSGSRAEAPSGRPAMLAVAAVALLLGACDTTGVSDEVALTTPLAPMEKPAAKVGQTQHWLRDGKQEFTNSIVAVDGDMVSGETSEGCQWTALSWGFAPGARWSGCAPFTDGQQKITGVEGGLWPLEVGRKVSYTFSGRNKNGDSWTGTRRCSVDGAMRIETVSGQHDTYKVVCKDRWTDRVWYVSPALGQPVYVERYRKTRNERSKRELIKVESAAPTS